MNAKTIKTAAATIAAIGASSYIAFQAAQIRYYKNYIRSKDKALSVSEENFKFALGKLNNTQFKEVISYSIDNRYDLLKAKKE